MTPLPNGLTHREDAVVEFVSLGFGNREIGQQLNLTDRQVRRIVDKCREKLGASNRAELIRLWMQAGR